MAGKRKLPTPNSGTDPEDYERFALTLGNGRVVHVPAYTAKDHDNARDFDVSLPNFEKIAGCPECGGRWNSHNKSVEGGWIRAIVQRWGLDYNVVRPCPSCVYGAYRRIAFPGKKKEEEKLSPACPDFSEYDDPKYDPGF
jgi:hypothetical protein